jgi:CubicO group peptidase (beta-lactamase class C family)
MLRYMEIYRTGGVGGGERILSAKSIDQMSTPYMTTHDGLAYGYGLMIHPNYRGVSLVEHGGNIKGVSAYVSCIRERGVSGVALTNLSSSPGADLLLGAMNVLLDAPTTARRVSFPKFALAPERLDRYVGNYVSGEGSSIKITSDGPSLTMESEGKRFSMRPTGLDTFAIRRNGLEAGVRFLIGNDGAPWALCSGFRIVPRVSADPAGNQK